MTEQDPQSPLIWTEAGQPRSRLYDDIYFSAEDGLAEARAVFLQGCGLPQAWRGRTRFVVGELGFGTGLNVLALIELWSRTRPLQGVLHIFSIEAHPISSADARRVLAHWPQLSSISERLVAHWPGQARGPHRVEFPEFGVILDVVVAEVAEALEAWSGRADAWFLDGFAPARNPAMWRDEVLSLVATRSAPGAVAATFTVAGHVRRGLAAAGFEVARAPGFGRKRERLTARLAGDRLRAGSVRRVAVIGAGIGGASVARAVRALGGDPVIIEATGRGSGASGNPVALVTPRLDAGLAEPAQLFAQAFRRAVALYAELPQLIVAWGALQFVVQSQDVARFEKIAGSDLFEREALAELTPEQTSARIGEPGPKALGLRDGLVIEPATLLAAWTPQICEATVSRIEPYGLGWRLLGEDGLVLAKVDAVIVAAGLATADLVVGLPLSAVRGQASWTTSEDLPPAAAFGAYAIPMRDGVLFGATNDRDDIARDVRPDDHRRNLVALAQGLPRLAARLADKPLEGRASIRVTTPDYLPVAGAAPGAPNGLLVLSGFGARGFTLAPLLAEHVAAIAMQAPSPLPASLARIVDPARFAQRIARRLGNPASPR